MWQIADKTVQSRLLLGTAHYPSLHIMATAIQAAQAEIITVSLGRQRHNPQGARSFSEALKALKCYLLPNTAGCRSAAEAITVAEMSRELFATNWIKLEVIGDDYTLQPNPFELVEATQALIKRGFAVFPYCTEDLVLCQRLVDAGCKILMPWGAPIGTGKGLLNPYALTTLRGRFPNITIIIDAGLGRPSHAAQAMEMGFDAVLLNTAVAQAQDPAMMARAFSQGVQAGRLAYVAGLIRERDIANPSTPLLDTPFWQQELNV